MYVCSNAAVLLPYEITLLSNLTEWVVRFALVLLPYEITLLSNGDYAQIGSSGVLLPYEITLLSNNTMPAYALALFYYLMKSHYSQT